MTYFLAIMLTILFYIGEDRGIFIAGVQGELRKSGMIIEADLRSYIPEVSSEGFHPNAILYKIGFGWENIRFFHDCYHDVSHITGKSYPPTNYVKISL